MPADEQMPSDKRTPTDKHAPTDEQMSYEQARAELAEVVDKLEAGGATLEESLQLWERGEQLADICWAKLDGARAKLAAAREAREAQRPGES